MFPFDMLVLVTFLTCVMLSLFVLYFCTDYVVCCLSWLVWDLGFTSSLGW